MLTLVSPSFFENLLSGTKRYCGFILFYPGSTLQLAISVRKGLILNFPCVIPK